MAIEDAWTLAHAYKPDHAAASLVRWERARRSRVAAVASVAARNRRIYHANGVVRLARNLTMRTVPPTLLARGMDFIYSWKPGETDRNP